MNDSDNGADGTFHLVKTISKNNLSCIISSLKEEVTYYFKLQAFDEVPNYSYFSKTVSATTLDETPPRAPSGVRISDRAYDSLNISWDANPEPDIVGYILYRAMSQSSAMLPVNPQPIETTHFKDSGLKDITTHYYKVKAVDNVGLKSEFSAIVNGTTLYSPRAPEINNSVSDVILKEDTVDNQSIKLYQIFKDLNNDGLMFWCTGQEHINVTINQNNGTVILVPEKDWSGEDIITFYASDGSYEIYDIIKIIVKPVNDRPRFVEIISPQNGLEIEDGELLDFIGNSIDPDVEYGDVLTYFWSSNLTGDFGQGAQLNNIKLGPGSHRITLTVSDKHGKFEHEFIKVNVLEKTHSDPAGDGNFILAVVMGIVVLVILLLLILLIIRKNLSGEIIKKDAKLVKPEYEGILRSDKAVDSTLTIIPLKTSVVSILDRNQKYLKYAEITDANTHYKHPDLDLNGEPINVIRLRNSELRQMKYPENYY
jgi:hypothetical protein